MVPEPTSEAWVQMRYKYEHTDQPVDDISAEHGISPGTLRDRVRRWGWARRRPPVPREGPPPAPAPQIDAAAPPLPTVGAFDSVAPSLAAAPQVETAAPCAASAPQVAAGEDAGACGEGGDSTITPRLQKRGCPRPARHRGDRREARHGGRASARDAVARVLPAIEATVAKLATGAAHPRELERAARALAALTRTLRELNGLLSQRQAAAADAHDDDMPEDIDAFRFDLARRIDAFVAARTGKPDRDGGPQAP